MEKPEAKESIKHAAVKTIDGIIFLTGKSHAECFRKAHEAQVQMSARAADQGFVTSLGRYVGREDAYNIALAAGQIAEPFGNVGVGVLFSEDLWSKHSGGRFSYDEVEGYRESDTSPA